MLFRSPASRTIVIPSKKIFCTNDEEEDEMNQESEFDTDIYEVLLSQVVEDDDFEEAPKLNNKKFNIDAYISDKVKIDSNKKQRVCNLFKNHRELFSTDLKDLKCIPNTNFVIETTTEIATRKLPYQLPAETNNKLKQICDLVWQKQLEDS